MVNNSECTAEEVKISSLGEVKRSEAFVVISYDHCFLYLNPLAEKFYKKSKAELIGRKIKDVFPEQLKFGPYKKVMESVDDQVDCDINYQSPFTKAWVQLVGRPHLSYYSFTYWLIDHKEALKKELREVVRKKT